MRDVSQFVNQEFANFSQPAASPIGFTTDSSKASRVVGGNGYFDSASQFHRNLSEPLGIYDMLEIEVVCGQFPGVFRRVIGVNAGITLYNLYRVLMYCFEFPESVASQYLHIWVLPDGTSFGNGGAFKAWTKKLPALLTDKNVTLVDFLGAKDRNFQFTLIFGKMYCWLVVNDILAGVTAQQDLLWVPRLCDGSVGIPPPVTSCADSFLIERHHAQYGEVNVDAINRELSHTRFGRNLASCRQTRRHRIETLCDNEDVLLRDFRIPIRAFFANNGMPFIDIRRKRQGKAQATTAQRLRSSLPAEASHKRRRKSSAEGASPPSDTFPNITPAAGDPSYECHGVHSPSDPAWYQDSRGKRVKVEGGGSEGCSSEFTSPPTASSVATPCSEESSHHLLPSGDICPPGVPWAASQFAAAAAMPSAAHFLDMPPEWLAAADPSQFLFSAFPPGCEWMASMPLLPYPLQGGAPSLPPSTSTTNMTIKAEPGTEGLASAADPVSVSHDDAGCSDASRGKRPRDSSDARAGDTGPLPPAADPDWMAACGILPFGEAGLPFDSSRNNFIHPHHLDMHESQFMSGLCLETQAAANFAGAPGLDPAAWALISAAAAACPPNSTEPLDPQNQEAADQSAAAAAAAYFAPVLAAAAGTPCDTMGLLEAVADAAYAVGGKAPSDGAANVQNDVADPSSVAPVEADNEGGATEEDSRAEEKSAEEEAPPPPQEQRLQESVEQAVEVNAVV